jgi:hypothetical protein
MSRLLIVGGSDAGISAAPELGVPVAEELEPRRRTGHESGS